MNFNHIKAGFFCAGSRLLDQDLGIWSDEHIEGFAKLTEQVKEQGSKIGIQLAHAGRKAELEGDIFAPSAIAFDEQSATPVEVFRLAAIFICPLVGNRRQQFLN